MTSFPPEQEAEYALPRWGIGWDVFCWIGQRRFSRHWSVSQIRHELADSYDIPLSDDAIEGHIASYQNMVAARHQDLGEMERAYRHGQHGKEANACENRGFGAIEREVFEVQQAHAGPGASASNDRDNTSSLAGESGHVVLEEIIGQAKERLPILQGPLQLV